MFKWLRGTHAVPVFAGKNSKSHQRLPLRELKARALRLSLGDRQFSDLECFVQFAGFPRSGHSLVGSILDAHEHCIVSHELDAMGLVAADFRLREIAALVKENSRLFTENDRFWNGFCYKVEEGVHGRATRLRVLGDKKGDWVTRRCGRDPGLIERLRRTTADKAVKWILVTRNPFDNIATMSLRKNALYDRLRIHSRDSESFERSFRERRGTDIATAVRADMVEDYAHLCNSISTMKRMLAAEDWLEIRHEDFIEQPEKSIGRILAFLELGESSGLPERGARIVSNRPHRSRYDVDWSREHSSRVSALIESHDFLSGYSFDD